MLKIFTTQTHLYQSNSRRSKLFAAGMVALAAVLLVGGIMQAHATNSTVAYSNDFESNTAGWAGSGSITRVASGTNGIASAAGGNHAVVTGTPGPNTQLGGYGQEWKGDWTTSTDVYLNPAWGEGSGFLYSVASNKANGANLRDFVFHAAVLNDETTGDVDKLVVLADTEGSADGSPQYQFNLLPVERRTEIAAAGWYSIKHTFRNIDGHLVVNVSLVNSSNQTVFSRDITNGSATDLVPSVVGGNRYGWFTHVTVPSGLAIDNVSRSVTGNEHNIPDDATDPVDVTLDANQTVTLLGVNDGAVTTPVDIAITSAANSTKIVIPAGTVITAQDVNWDGTLNVPTVESVGSVTVSGGTAVVSSAVKVGANTPLTFSQPVKVVITGQAGKLAGYIDGTGKLHPITTACASDAADTLVNGVNECYATEGSDLVIWTNHFSVFAAYSLTADGTTVPGAPNAGVGPSEGISLQNFALFAVAGGMLLFATIVLIRRRAYAVTSRRNK